MEDPKVRASQWLHKVRWMESAGHLEPAKKHLGAEELAMLKSPPLVSSWISYQRTEQLDAALERLGGIALARQGGYETTRLALPVLQPLIEGYSRLFGLSPAVFFSRLQTFAEANTRGIHYSYEKSTERSGLLTMKVAVARPVSVGFFASGAGALMVTFDTCSLRTGVIENPEWISEKERNAVRFRIHW